MLKPILILSLVLTTTTTGQCQKISFNTNNDNLSGDACITMQNGVEVDGSCTTIERCPLVFDNLLKRIYNHVVCGYAGTTQIICCPNNDNTGRYRNTVKINLRENLECRVADSNESGVWKFIDDCSELTKRNVTNERNTICDYEICSDLVCCPVTSKTRLKNVCWMVDAPSETLETKLLRNLECTVKELNLTGVYQQSCEYADRHPHLKSILQNVCNDDSVCSNWYCCPIEDLDLFYCTATLISSSLATLVGPKCIDSKTGRQGTCKKYCPSSSHMTLDKCGSYCCSDFYCCPDIDTLVDQSVSSRECTSYTKYLSKEEIEVPMNGYINQTQCPGRVVATGGYVVSPGDYPHMAALGYESEQKIFWNCGGSLISDRFVLTAAHCLTNRTIGDLKKVRLGVIDLLNNVNMADCPEEFDVARTIFHPEYNPKLVYNDIGLIELVGQVKYNFHIRPICLPSSADIPASLESMGWGALGPTENQSEKLIVVQQELFSYEECQEHYQYSINRRLDRGIQNVTHICAGSRDSIQSTCTGDSGGPLLAHHETYGELFYIYGVVSFGTVCGFVNSPGVYTKVFPYVKWIVEMVWNN